MLKELSIVFCTMVLLAQDIASVPLRNNDRPITQWSGQINGFEIDRVPGFGTGSGDKGNGNNGVGNLVGNGSSGMGNGNGNNAMENGSDEMENETNEMENGSNGMEATNGSTSSSGSSNGSSGWISSVSNGSNNGIGSISNSSSGWISTVSNGANNGMGSISNSSSGWISGINNGSNNGMGSISNSSSGWVSSFTNASNNGMESVSNLDNGFSNGMGSNNIMGDEQWSNGFNWRNNTNAGIGAVQNQANKYSGYPSSYYQKYSQTFVVPTRAPSQNDTPFNTSTRPVPITNHGGNMGNNNPTEAQLQECGPQSSSSTVSPERERAASPSQAGIDKISQGGKGSVASTIDSIKNRNKH